MLTNLLFIKGVYRGLISTTRTTDSTIPVQLGNLRQEIEAERAFLRYRLREDDLYPVFSKALRKRHRRRRSEVGALLSLIISDLWQEFKDVERPFLIRNPFRAEKVRRGDFWGESDLDEKPVTQGDGKKKVNNRMCTAEAGLYSDQQQQRYYNTDLAHRLTWWQSRTAVENMLLQVQRIRIQRIERDAFETDELIKRYLRILSGGGPARGGRSRSRSSSGPGSGDGGGGLKIAQRRSVRPGAGSVQRVPSRRASRGGSRFRKKVETREDTVHAESRVNTRDPESSNTGPPRERTPRPRYEYEMVQAGRSYGEGDERPVRRGDVEYVDIGQTPGRRPSERLNSRRNGYVGDRPERRYRTPQR
ncbi:uncharacterized protein A1O9_10339 [Exophiala aquamarina CBS 119918]|uniref:Uncharacterized protein n=1 Tax=Exophiala aquamarina CBS 119918 TaxID=1182545 RepID=A0A072NZT3_9EURO|nr:uncharacterized protein A1O9_10339 [Exophiala aquamarina CBS 119918]KEF53364.1 hypothetical protein A1O9_10339 [Exophiala aquamarina CBS 119918]